MFHHRVWPNPQNTTFLHSLNSKFQTTLLLRFPDKGLWTYNLVYPFFFFLVLKYSCKYAGHTSPGCLCEGAERHWLGGTFFQVFPSTLLKSVSILWKRKKSYWSPSCKWLRSRPLPMLGVIGCLGTWTWEVGLEGGARWDASLTSESQCHPGHRNVVASLEKCR